MYYKTYRNPPRRFAVHRRVTRRHLHSAAFGNATTIGAAVVWLIMFFSMWILILRTFEDNSIYKLSIMQLKTGKYANILIDEYRQENGGKLPESLEAIGFRKSYDDNIYYFQPSEGCYCYELEYIRLNDTEYCLNFGDGMWFKGQYLSTIGHWNYYCTKFDSESCDWVIDESWGEDASKVYLYEYEFPEWFDSIKVPLESIVRSNRGRQQYMLRISDRNNSVCGWINNDDTISCINYNCVLHTFDAMLWPDIDYFRDIQGYTMLGDKVCFIIDETNSHHLSILKYNGKGRVFNVPENRGCVGGEHYWYLDIDADYGGKVTLKGVRVEE
ncbi:MAG: hypothetical protein J6X58_07905 [Bacteroidales bacterium]|nr:hypothetical protein [Bacteroidales bacterium]